MDLTGKLSISPIRNLFDISDREFIA